jgi:hypothetical protein
MKNPYQVVPRKFWQRKPGFTGIPENVSLYGALPRPVDAYEMVEKGWSIYDSRNNTYSNYFFGKIGIETLEEANNIILRLTDIHKSV